MGILIATTLAAPVPAQAAAYQPGDYTLTIEGITASISRLTTTLPSASARLPFERATSELGFPMTETGRVSDHAFHM